jgi:peptidoglycan/xylan/chitin deacetylase (PgdA/CDA1 family)
MILMYHHVCPTNRIPNIVTDLEGWQFNISPQQFENQLRAVSDRGFKFVSLAEYVDHLSTTTKDRTSRVAVTFDDGWVDNFEYAFPVLEQLGIPSTFFIVAGDMPGIDRGRRMSDNQLREMESRGMTIGGHSMTHPNLAMLGEEKLAEEIQGCRADLQDRLGSSIDFFAYPGGRFNQAVMKFCEQAGYRGACSTISWGKNSPASRFYLFRDVLSTESDQLADRLKLSRFWRELFRWRAMWRLRTSLNP